MPAISVLMPCYNAAITIEETLKSLSVQTLKNFEVVAVDDGSQDGTMAILKRWAQQDSRFRVVQRPHAGIIAALNYGLEICQSPYIARMDADDLAHPDRLSEQVAYLTTHPEVTLVSSLVSLFPQEEVQQGFRLYIDWLNGLRTHADICREIFVESPFVHPSVAYLKDFVTKLGGYQDHGWAEDYDLWLRMVQAGARFAKIPTVLLHWREYPRRLTRIDHRYSQKNFVRAKIHYLVQGPLSNRDAVILWGAGNMGRLFSRYLLEHPASQPYSLEAYVDIDPKKIGRVRRGHPVIPPEALLDWWKRYQSPVVLVAVGARGARVLIRERLEGMGLIEGQDWWAVA